MGPAFVRRRMLAELGPDWASALQELRAAAGGLRLARPGAPRRSAMTARRSPPSCSTPTCSRPWRRISTQLRMVFALHARMNPAVETGEIIKEIAARLREELDYELEASHTALYGADLRRRAEHPRAARAAGAVHQAAADHDLARGPQAHGLQGRAAGAPQHHCAGHVPRLVVSVLALRRDPRRPASRQLHHLRDGRATRTARAAPGNAGRHQPARLRLHPHLPDAVRARRDRPLHRPADGQARSRRARLRDLGLRRPVQRADRHLEHLGALHLRPAARRPRARDRRRHHARPVRPQGGLHRAQSA